MTDEASSAESAPTDDAAATGGGFRARRLAGNIGSLLTSTAFERAMRFVLYAMVARSLGAEDLGRLAIAVAVFQLVSRLVLAGVPVVVTREIAHDRDRRMPVVLNASVGIVGTSIVGYLGLIAFLAIVSYEAATASVVWALFTGLVVFCLSKLLEAAFVGLELSKYIAAVTVPINLLQTAAAFVLLSAGYGVEWIAGSIAVSYALIAVAFVVIFLRGASWSTAGVGLRPSLAMLRESLPFLGIEGTTVVRTSSNAIIISVVLGETAVGIFSAASQLQVPLRLVGNALGTGLFPVMVRAYRRSVETLRVVTARAVDLAIAIVLPGVVGLVILGRPLLSLIYGGDEFADSNDVLAILAWGSLAGTVASVLGRVLIAALQEITTLRIAVVNTVLQLILAVVLTQQFGIQGTAFAVLVTALVNVAQHAFPVRKSLGSFIDPRGMAVPILASAAMAIVLVVLPDIHVLLATLVGIVVYFVSFAGVAVVVAGGWSGVKQSWSLSVPSGDPG